MKIIRASADFTAESRDVATRERHDQSPQDYVIIAAGACFLDAGQAWRRSCGCRAQDKPTRADHANRDANDRRLSAVAEDAPFVVASATMKTFRNFVIATSMLGGAAAAPPLAGGEIEIDRPWCGETSKGMSVGACYVTIRNLGATADRLSAATSSASERVEFHEMKVSDGIMKMRLLSGGVEIPAGATVDFHARGYHIMLPELKAPLRAGTTVRGSLIFERSGSVPVEYRIERLQRSIHGRE